MNKRIQQKVAKRNNGGVTPSVSAAKKPSASNATAKKGKPQTRTAKGPAGTVDRARAAVSSAVDEAKARVEHAVDDAKQRVESAVDEAKAKVATKVADLKTKLHDKEQQAEEALSKIPVVGKAAAAKLHELTK